MVATLKRFGVIAVAVMIAVVFASMPAMGKASDNAEKGKNRGYTPTDGRSAQPKSSNQQGSSKNTSNPDGGGIDKPVPATQGTSDWDWNNGCGNDDDRDDDNNGWCGRKPSNERSRSSVMGSTFEGRSSEKEEAKHLAKLASLQSKRSEAHVAGSAGTPEGSSSGAVLSAQGSRPGTTTAVLGAAFSRVLGGSGSVLGSQTEVLGAGSELPLTGAPIAAVGAFALALIAFGAHLSKRSRI